MDTKQIKVKVDRGVFHSIVSEITPEIMDDSQQPEWSVKELDKLYDRLFVDNYDNLFDLELSQQGWEESGILQADEVTLEFFRKYLKMPKATLEELCKECLRLKDIAYDPTLTCQPDYPNRQIKQWRVSKEKIINAITLATLPWKHYLIDEEIEQIAQAIVKLVEGER